MRDETIISEFKQIYKWLNQIENSVKLALSGEAIRAQATQDLLIKKGLITETEMQQAIGDIIQKLNTQKEEPKKEEPQIVAPTQEEIKTVADSVEKPKE
jgi:putative heme degradation protein